jgi:hypothetical protein
LILKLFNGFGIILNTFIVSQRDNKKPIREIAEDTITLRFIVLFKSLIGSVVVAYFINYLLGVIIKLSFYSVYSKLVFLFLFY